MYKVYHGAYDRSKGLIETTVSLSFFTFSSVWARTKENKGKFDKLVIFRLYTHLLFFQQCASTIKDPQTAFHLTELIPHLSCFQTGLQQMCAEFQNQNPCLQSQTIELCASSSFQQHQSSHTAGSLVYFKKLWIALGRCRGWARFAMAAMFVKAMGQRAAQIAITLLRQVVNTTIASFVVVPHFTTLATQMGFLGIKPSMAILPPLGYLLLKRHIVKVHSNIDSGFFVYLNAHTFFAATHIVVYPPDPDNAVTQVFFIVNCVTFWSHICPRQTSSFLGTDSIVLISLWTRRAF